MGMDTTSQIPILTTWAFKAEKKIGSYYGWKKMKAVIDVKGCIAKLPVAAMKVQYVVLGDQGCDCGELMGSVAAYAASFDATSNDVFLNIDLPDQNQLQCAGNAWEVQDNKIVFQSNLDGQKVTIQYLGYVTDSEGFIEVNENHVDAIAAYIMHKFAERTRFSPNKMDHADLKRLKNAWLREKNMAIADDSQLSETDRQEIVAMLSDPYIGNSLEFGMI
jgi:hypothetical protein